MIKREKEDIELQKKDERVINKGMNAKTDIKKQTNKKKK